MKNWIVASNLISHLILRRSLVLRGSLINSNSEKNLYLLCNHVRYIIFRFGPASLYSSNIYASYMAVFFLSVALNHFIGSFDIPKRGKSWTALSLEYNKEQ